MSNHKFSHLVLIQNIYGTETDKIFNLVCKSNPDFSLETKVIVLLSYPIVYDSNFNQKQLKLNQINVLFNQTLILGIYKT